MMEYEPDTIVSLATPIGRASVGIIRISGPLSYSIGQTILKKKFIKPRYAYYLPFYDGNDSVLDYGIALFFKGPYSFTGEDVLELQAHGGPAVLDQLLQTVFLLGARLAEPGEFSKRAFLNSKIDLIQAEAIADLISASSERAARSALSSLQGDFSKQIHPLTDEVIQLRTYLEAAIDFSEDEINFLTEQEIHRRIEQILTNINTVIQRAKQGALLREGMSVVIVGRPNVGKSSLLNCLSGRETAIVTEMAGTTRDVLREYITVDGMPLHIIDTAGLQETQDVIEQEGIRRAWQEIEKADKILLVIDSSQTRESDPDRIYPEFFSRINPSQAVTVIRNKIDLTQEGPKIEKRERYDVVFLSVKKRIGIDLLISHLKDFMGFQPEAEGVFLARRRHLEALQRAQGNLISAKNQWMSQRSLELMAEEIRQAQQALSEMTGEFTSNDLLGEIFSSFCIGK